MVVKALETITLARVDDGTAGKDITSYASGTALPATVAPANSQFWLTNSAGVAIKFYKSTGTAWVEQPISAAAINAATFNGLTFTGVTFNGSTFMSANSRVIADGEEELYTAGTTLTNTQTLDKMGYTSVAQGSIMGDTTPNSFKATTTIGNTGSIRSRADFASGDWSIITIDPTQSAMTMSNSQNTSGTLNADYLSRVNNCGKMLWSGTAFLNEKQTLRPSIAIDECLNGWMLEWQEYKNGSAAGTDVLATPIYSRMVARLSGAGFNLPMATYGGASFNKYCYPTNTTLTGNAKNGTAGSSAANYVLTAIFAF
jgi:hypothetical protein